jgi:hypothetical protein
MKNRPKMLVILGIIFVFAIVSTSLMVNSQIQNNNQLSEKELDDVATPIVDYQFNQPIDNNRRNKNIRFDGRNIVRQNVRPNSEIIITPSEKISDFPFEGSNLVAEGIVIDSSAHLSNDKSGVYSEFNIRLTEIVAGDPTFKNGDIITGTRFGGRVKYPSGQIVRYRVSNLGSPMKEKRYLFFLKATSETDYKILTAYELRGNKIVALDGIKVKNNSKGKNIFDKHTGQDIPDFKREVAERLVKGGKKNE